MSSEIVIQPYEQVALSKCCKIISGSTPSRKNPEYWNGDINWFTPKDLSKLTSKFLSSSPEKITEIGQKSCSTSILPTNSLLLSSRAPIGHIAITTEEACTNQGFKSLVPNNNVSVDYLYYAIKKIVPRLKDLGNGATFKEISKATLSKVEIPLPPLAEQQKIAAILDAADKLRQKDQQLIDHYTTLSQSLFLELFQLDRGKSKHRPRNDPQLLGGTHPLIQTGDVANCGGYITKYSSTYSDIGLKQSKKWSTGTLCITIAANIAKTGILTFEACFPDSVVGFINNEKTNIEFVQYWMSFLQKILEETAPMAAQKNINLKILRELEIPLPPIEQQNQFAQHIEKIEQQKQQAQASLEKSETLFNSLLQRAFKGELTG